MNVSKNKILKGWALSALVAMTVGCASVDSQVKSRVDNSYKLVKSADGIAYGSFFILDDQSVKTKLCEAVNYSDARCQDLDNYNAVNVFHGFGFKAAAANSLALAPKDFPAKNTCGRVGDSKCTYVSVKVAQNSITSVIDIASANNDNKCYWKGGARSGGTVCPAYNWDYRKDLNDWDTTNGVLSVDK
ncbi:hypothetical protein [Methylotenera versatilis]|uniref:hypothetical protein n=1 Tax=Methylotenera versatilis TaxID=1055487 RepID=UPI0006488BF0|nr:hypothetical protein [Methylotenera versatilis]